MSEEQKTKVKALFPEDVEGIYISKNDYDRLYGDLTLENIELKQEIERLNKRIEDLNIINEEHRILNGMIRKQLQQKENIIKEVREYIEEHSYDYRIGGIAKVNGKEILDILDKVGDEK